MTLTLYSTASCELCDRALELLRSMPELRDVKIDVVDIALDDGLMDAYGELIPVLAKSGARIAETCNWPFNADDVVEWLAG